MKATHSNETDFTTYARESIYAVLGERLTEFDHLCRDMEQALVLSGVIGQSTQQSLIHIREKIEDAAHEIRGASCRHTPVGG